MRVSERNQRQQSIIFGQYFGVQRALHSRSESSTAFALFTRECLNQINKPRELCAAVDQAPVTMMFFSHFQIHRGGSMTEKLLWFLAGVGLGTLAGVLYAPQSGDETRETLRSSAQQGREFVADRTQRAREQANQWVERGREVMNDQKENFRNAYETGRQAYQEATTPKTGTTNS
jgi:gas vesicle protein